MTKLNPNKNPFFLSILLICLFCFTNDSFGQCDGVGVAVCGISTSLSNVENANIIEPNSEIIGTVIAQGTAIGSPLIIKATGLGVVSMNITIDFSWQQGNNINWIHGVSFENSEGWSSSQGSNPGEGFLFQNDIVGCCSQGVYGAGYYFDGTSNTSNCCGGAVTGNPADNWGIGCSGTNCPSFTFALTYCPTSINIVNESVTFILTDDGETGDWSNPAGGVFRLTFPITILPAPDVTTGNDGAEIDGENIIYYCDGDSVLLGINQEFDTYEWSTGSVEDSIYVTPISDSTQYMVTVQNDIGCEVVVDFLLLDSLCCEANAGNISNISNNSCSGEISVLVENQNKDSLHENMIIVTDDTGEITGIEHIDSTGNTFEFFSATGTYFFYSFNYFKSDFVNLPNVGNSINSIDCSLNCCDLKNIGISIAASPTPSILTNPPADLTLNCGDPLPPLVDLAFGNSNLDNTNTGIISGTMSDQYDQCTGGTIQYNWSGSDNCGNALDYTQTITITPATAAAFVNPPTNMTIACNEAIPSLDSLSYSNGLSGNCEIVGKLSGTITGDAQCQGTLIYEWSGTTSCGNPISHTRLVSVESPPTVSYINPPDNLTLSCADDFPPMTDLAYSNDNSVCPINGSVAGTEQENGSSCTGSSVIRTWDYIGPCGNVNRHTQIITKTCSAIEADAGQDISFNCDENTLMLEGNVTSGTSIQWSTSNGVISGGGSSLSPTITGAGTYILTATGSGNCSQTDTVFVTNAANLEIAVNQSQSIACDPSSETLISVDILSGNEPFTILWSTGSSNAIIENVTPGTYTVTVSDDGGCSVVDSITVNEITLLEATIEYENQIINCSNTPPSYEVVASGGVLPYSYLWSDGSTMTVPASLGASQGMVTVTDASGCFVTAVAELIENFEMPEFELSATTLTCLENIATATATVTNTNDYIVIWTNEAGQGISISETVEINMASQVCATVTSNENGCMAMQCIDILEDVEEPIINLNVSNILNCTDTTAIITNSGSQGNNFTYEWMYNEEVFEISNSVTVAEVGTYTVVVTNLENGCINSDSIEVLIDEEVPVVTLSVANMITCDEPTATITYNGPQGSNITNEWQLNSQPFNMPSDLIVSESGIYDLITTNTDIGCSATSQVEITENVEAPVFEISSTIITCATPQAVCTIVTNNDYSIEWTNSAGVIISTAKTVSVDIVGIYCAQVTNLENGCSSTQCTEVLENVEIPIASLSVSNELNCKDTTAIISFDSPNGSYAFVWPLDVGVFENNGLTVSESGTYSITVTDTDNGCTAVESIEVIDNSSEITANAGSDITIDVDCEEMPQFPVTLDATLTDNQSQFMYQWTFNNDTLPNSDTLMLDVFEAGIYVLEVTDTLNYCSGTDTVLVEINSFNTPDANIESDGNLNCMQTEVVLDATSSTDNISNYQWFTPTGSLFSTDETVVVTEAGYYSVIVTNAQGCTDQQLIQVTEDIIEVAFSNDIPLCFDDAINLEVFVDGSNPPFTLNWGNGDSGNSTVITAQTPTALTITDSIGCVWDVLPQNIDFPLPLFVENIDIINETDNDASGSIAIQSSGGALPYSYLWNTGETSSTITDLETGFYSTTITDANGCKLAVDSILVDMITATNAVTNTAIRLYPNPTNGSLNIHYSGASFEGIIHLYNQLGQSVYQLDQVVLDGNYSIQLPSSIIDGMYILSIESEGKSFLFEKIIINR